ncbi:MAG: sigma-70 family RNA polymerase sigma factor [Bacilli bacterium]|nr:sigma-70 family RNA polymerase sigma factor [Bacilli bacterium]
MIEKYSPIIKKQADMFIKKYPNLNMDKDELIQEGILGLINAIDSFTERRNCIFYTYAVLLIKREMLKHIKKCSCSKNLVLTLSKSISESVYENELFLEDTIYSKKDLVEEVVLSNYYERLLNNFKYELSIKESPIYELRINNFSNKEISILLDLPYKSVDNNWRSIKKKLLDYIQQTS